MSISPEAAARARGAGVARPHAAAGVTARTDAAGDLVLLEEQDRSRWNRDYIQEGSPLVERALIAQRSRRAFGPYALQAGSVFSGVFSNWYY